MNALFRLFCVSCLLCAAVQAEELPKSSACRTALHALEEAEDAHAAAAASAAPPDQQRQRLVAARLQPMRQRVADACLGGLTTSPSPSQHTWVAPSLPSRPDAVAPRVPTPPVTSSIPRVEPPVMVTHCTAATCFGSDGSMLTRVGPTLVGPRGTCTVQGNFLRCP